MSTTREAPVKTHLRFPVLCAIGTLAILLTPIIIFKLSFLSDWAPSSRADLWLHVAAVNAFLDNLLDPSFPMLNDLSIRSLSPYHFIVALFAKVTNLNSFYALRMYGWINLLLFFFALNQFSTFLPGKKSVSFFLVCLCIYSLWGIGAGYSGEYHLRLVPFIASYPSFFTLSLCLIALSRWSVFVSNNSKKEFFIVALLFVTVFSIHQLQYLYFLIPSSVLFARYRSMNWQRIIKYIGIFTLCGIAVLFVWPYVSLGGILEKALSVFASGFFSDSSSLSPSSSELAGFYSSRVIDNFGPAFLGILLLPFISEKKSRILLAGLVAVPGFFWIMYLLCSFPPLGWRFSAFTVFWLQITTAWYLAERIQNPNLRRSITQKLLFLVPLILCLIFFYQQLRISFLIYSKGAPTSYGEVAVDMAKLKEIRIPPHPVVESSNLHWMLTSFGIDTGFSYQRNKELQFYIARESDLSISDRCSFLESHEINLLAREASDLKSSSKSLKAPMPFELGYSGKVLDIYMVSACDIDFKNSD